MYIYENHMGGLYTSEEELDYDVLYCEQCGDSDSLIGTADSIDEAWEMLKPWDLYCEKCDIDPDEDWETCNSSCPYEADMGWNHCYSLGYVLEFLGESFECEDPVYVAFVGKCGDYVFYEAEADKCGRGIFPVKFCWKEEFAEKTARGLSLLLETPDTVKKFGEINKDGKRILVYICEDIEPENLGEDVCWWKGEDFGYCGWKKLEDTRPQNDVDRKILEILKTK